MKKKIILILAYFGELPNYSELFFNSIKANEIVDLLFVTDQDIKFNSQNIILKKMSFSELKKKIEASLKMEITLDKPYKLTDYKPSYGLVFKEDILDYVFWGYTDMDVIFGNIKEFFKKIDLYKYDKLYNLGHLTLFKNKKEINRLFLNNVGMNYKNVYKTSIIKVFDEKEGIDKKFVESRKKVYHNNKDFFDISPWHFNFRDSQCDTGNTSIFEWNNGELVCYKFKKKKLIKTKLLYVHFQKRILPIHFKESNHFFFSNSGFYDAKEIKSLKDAIKIYSKNSNINEAKFRIKFYNFIWLRRFKKYILKRM